MDPLLVAFGAGVGLLVGLTGMGGGSLMTPLLVLVSGVPPVIAVGTDIAYAAVTKTVGGLTHLRHGTVDRSLAGWLAVGSVPSALVGVTGLEALSRRDGATFDALLVGSVGVALLVSAAAVTGRSLLAPRADRPDGPLTRRERARAVAVGAAVGLVLGVTSAGSGALTAVALLLVFRMVPSRVVGTDVAHAAVLLWAVTLAHALADNVDYAAVGTILLGSVPAVWVGSRLCVHVPGAALRTLLSMVMLAAGVALLDRAGIGVPVPVLVVGVLVVAAAGAAEWLRRWWSAAGRFRHAVALLWPYVRSEWRLVVLALGSVLAASAVALARPWPIKVLVDDVLRVGAGGALAASPTTVRLVALVIGAVLAIALLQGLFGYLETLSLTAAGQRISTRVRSALFAHLHRLPMTFHDRQRTGDLVTRVTSDVSRVQENVLDDLLVVALARMIQVGGILVVMLAIDWRVGLVACATVPLTTLTSMWFRRRIRARESRVRSREGDIASMAQETMSSMRTVKVLGRHDVETRRFDDASDDMMAASISVARLEAGFGWALTLVAAASVAAVIGFGTRQVLTGALSAGTLIVFVQYMRDLQSPLLGLSRLQAKLAKASVRAERILEVLDEPAGVAENPDARPVPGRLAGEVRFERVSFAYDGGAPVLREVDLVVRPGEVVAVVGPSGVGKTTLASLLLRLYDPTAGRVLVDGVDVRDYTLDSYVAQTAVVLQETLLFRATVRENIAYGRPGATLDEVRAAARLANADGFIGALPDGYDTIVGERGATLSGGQRQRIAIARALVRDAPILVLDEPTTGLDADAERVVLDALDGLVHGRTTLLVAHKPSTVGRADRVVALEGGRLVERDRGAA